MRIAHRAGVDAALQDAVGVSGNAAGIGGHGILRYILTFQQVIEGAFDVFKIRRHVILADGGVDRRRIGAVQQRAGILAGDTTGELTAPYHTGRAAVGDLAAGLVFSGDAAYIVTAHDDSDDHIFVIVDGEVRIVTGDREIIAGKDQAVFVKGMTPHSIWNNGAKTAVVIKISTEGETK